MKQQTQVMTSSLNYFVEHKNPHQTQYYKHTNLNVWKNMKVCLCLKQYKLVCVCVCLEEYDDVCLLVNSTC